MAGNAPRTIAQLLGRNAEQKALRFLQKNGLRLITRNFRCRLGEIDLIMSEGNSLVVVEVRHRKTSRFASAAHTVNRHKQIKIAATAAMFLGRYPQYSDCCVRFDVVAFNKMQDGDCKLQWIKDAFRPE